MQASACILREEASGETGWHRWLRFQDCVGPHVVILMRRLALQFLFITVAFSACKREEIANTNSPVSASSRKLTVGASSGRCLDLNSATTEELARLPGIGEATARKIVEYREQNGPFRRTEEIIIVDGFSEQKYRSIAHLVCAE